MRALAEFRVPEEHAAKFLEDDCGTILYVGYDPFIRKVETPVGSSLYCRIGQLDKKLKGGFFHGWNVRYKYLKSELTAAQLFHLEVTAVFEPAGEECGTIYGGDKGCRICGGGFQQLNDLHLDLRRVPKKKDIARTIADEWIVSERLARLMAEWGIAGYELRPVRQKAFFADDPVLLHRVPTGRELLKRAEALGLEPDSLKFMRWLGEPEQRELTERAETENFQRLKKKYAASKPPAPWFQLVITAPRVPMVPPTLFGTNPFEEDPKGEYRCKYAWDTDHVVGLNRLSEVNVAAIDWDGSDITSTTQLVGTRRGVLRPAPLLLISPRFWRLLTGNKIRSFKEEVAYLR